MNKCNLKHPYSMFFGSFGQLEVELEFLYHVTDLAVGFEIEQDGWNIQCVHWHHGNGQSVCWTPLQGCIMYQWINKLVSKHANMTKVDDSLLDYLRYMS